MRSRFDVRTRDTLSAVSHRSTADMEVLDHVARWCTKSPGAPSTHPVHTWEVPAQGSTYRRGKTVQTTGTTSVLARKRPLMVRRLHEKLGIPVESLIKEAKGRAA